MSDSYDLQTAFARALLPIPLRKGNKNKSAPVGISQSELHQWMVKDELNQATLGIGELQRLIMEQGTKLTHHAEFANDMQSFAPEYVFWLLQYWTFQVDRHYLIFCFGAQGPKGSDHSVCINYVRRMKREHVPAYAMPEYQR